ncbi:MAG: secondary thiamine-phosphate synthase enzyme [Candidatus Omnitrophica bacterium CG23_combo_of_CG06-09_8_20_14_all_41_10]|uniref:Secondary thiamine-phosphate synthase enzyme n=1 Tax=Candidatus Sherwoodlollariibacterium unditelluris TaxID=1974757 RepID=A0A2G9YHZ9_9BACT|nr:MAG: secondary thiamine-phosphate synthase enzyme [Candidatus Omnitrophica bacterium CG23_combo_of_CG06-09_8_20_14_all_41_10]
MKIITKQLNLKTKGAGDLIDITAQIQKNLEDSGLQEGNVTVFVIGSTAAITTFEYESGLISDLKELYEQLVPSNKTYAHDETWGDANGFSHLRAALQGPSLVVPFISGRLILGTWQQVVLAEFDHRPRQRRIVLQFVGSIHPNAK